MMRLLIASVIVFLSSFGSFANEPEANERYDDLEENTDKALNRIDIKTSIGLNPKDIRDALTAGAAIGVARTQNVYPSGEPSSEHFLLNLDGQDTMPVVHLRIYQTTSIQFVDASGTPWPIEKLFTFDKKFIALHEVSKARTNSGIINANIPKGDSYIQAYLSGLDLPVTFRVIADPMQKGFNSLAVFKIGKLSPFSELNLKNTQVAQSVSKQVDDNLVSVANGVRPTGYNVVTTDNKSVRAWSDGTDMLILTEIIPVNPYPVDTITGINGWTAHRLRRVSPLYFFDKNGDEIKVGLEL